MSRRAVEKKIFLEDYVRRKYGDKDLYKNLVKLYKDYRDGKIILLDPDPPQSMFRYVLRPDYSLWFWTVIISTLLGVSLVYLTSLAGFLMPLRYVIGSLLILFIPGYVLVEALYPGEKDLLPLERLALSMGLSLAIVPLIGLILNYTPWGIRLDPIIISLSIYIISISILAVYRKSRRIILLRKTLSTE
jgi:uncharacterized membrane protein